MTHLSRASPSLIMHRVEPFTIWPQFLPCLKFPYQKFKLWQRLRSFMYSYLDTNSLARPFLKKRPPRGWEVDQQLKAPPSLEEDSSSVPSTCVRRLTNDYN